MKTSVILFCALFFNTAILLGEPLAFITQTIGTWQFIVLECLLLLFFYLNSLVKGLRKDLTFDFKNLNVFVFKGLRKGQAEKSHKANLF